MTGCELLQFSKVFRLGKEKGKIKGSPQYVYTYTHTYIFYSILRMMKTALCNVQLALNISLFYIKFYNSVLSSIATDLKRKKGNCPRLRRPCRAIKVIKRRDSKNEENR